MLLDVVVLAGGLGGEESLGDATGVPCVDVEPTAWPVVLRAAHEVGAWLDWLGASTTGVALERRGWWRCCRPRMRTCSSARG